MKKLTALFCILILCALLAADISAMQVLVKTSTGKSITVDAEASDTILSIKNKVLAEEGIAVALQKIVYNGSVLENGKTLADYNIQPDDTLQLQVLSGGEAVITFVKEDPSYSFHIPMSTTLSEDELGAAKDLGSVYVYDLKNCAGKKIVCTPTGTDFEKDTDTIPAEYSYKTAGGSEQPFSDGKFDCGDKDTATEIYLTVAKEDVDTAPSGEYTAKVNFVFELESVPKELKLTKVLADMDAYVFPQMDEMELDMAYMEFRDAQYENKLDEYFEKAVANGSLLQLTVGQELPDDKMMVVYYGDYCYVHSVMYGDSSLSVSLTAAKDQTTYGMIASEVAGVPLTDVSCLFMNCTKMTEVPAIPETVNQIGSFCQGCTSLVNPPKLPSALQYGGNAFDGCTSLATAPELPEGTKRIAWMFQNCTSLETAPVFPSSVEAYYYLFNGCTNLKGTIVINSVTVDQHSYSGFLAGVPNAITLTGDASLEILQLLASTGSNVTVQK